MEGAVIVKLLIKTGSKGCEFALVDLTPELATLIMQRKTVFDSLKLTDSNLDELVYNSYAAQFFDDDYLIEEDSKSSGLMDQDNGFIEASADFAIATEPARTECDKMVIDWNGVTFRAYPKHCDWLVTTHEIDYATVEEAAGVAA